MARTTRVLIVEDEAIIALDVARKLRSFGYDVAGTAACGADALELAEETRPDLALMDIVLEGEMDGIETAEQMRLNFNIPVVFLTAYADPQTLERAKISEAYGYVLKPFRERELHASIEVAVYKKGMESKLMASEERYALAVRGAGEGLWDWKCSSGEVYYSPRFRELLGYEGQAFPDVFESLESRLHPDDRVQFNESLEKHVRGGGPFDQEARLRTRSGEYRWFRCRGQSIRNDKGHSERMAGAIGDITEHKLAESALIQARLDAEAAALAKSEFLNVVTHELRTPLNAIIGYADLLDSEVVGSLNEEQRDFVGQISDSGKQQLQMIEDVLLMTSLDDAARDVACDTCHVDLKLREEIDRVQSTADEKGIALELEVADRIPPIETDEAMFSELVRILLRNAVEFTTKGGRVRVSAGLRTEPDSACEVGVLSNNKSRKADTALLQVSIADTGIGIREEDRERIFDTFEQVDSSLSRAYGGLGLGLALARRLVMCLRGRIWVESEPSTGSTFTFVVPVASRKRTHVEPGRCLQQPSASSQ